MARKIQVKRGLKKDLPVLSTGEFAFVKDTKEIVIGGEGENIGLAKASDVQAVATQVAGKASADSVTALTSQLADKATKTDLIPLANKAEKSEVTAVISQISSLDTKINSQASGSPKGTYATLSALQTAFPTGNNNTYIVAADGYSYYWNGTMWAQLTKYQSDGLAFKSITSDKVAFVKIGSSNLFNKNTSTLDKYVSPDNGNLGTLANFFVSDFIPVEPSMQYIINVARHYAIYDANKTYISGVTPTSPFTNVIFTTPANARYIRFSNNASGIDTNRVNVGNSVLPYEPFYLAADEIKPKLNDKQVKSQHIDDRSITPEHIAFVVPETVQGKNLFNAAKVTTGRYINWSSGIADLNAGYDISDFIAVKSSTAYARKQSSHIAFYDANRVVISGLQTSGVTFTTPSNAAYIRVSVATGTGGAEQIEEGSISTTYEKFGYSLPGLLSSNDKATVQVKINLPTKIYALVGQELNIYFDNILNVTDTDYDIDVIAAIGDQYKDFFRFTPDGAGSFPITIKVLKNNVELVSASSTIIVKGASVGNGISKKVVLIGDSTTNNGFPSIKLNENFKTDSMNITLLGTRGTAPDLHEGRSGWMAKHYVQNAELSGIANAFWNPTTSKFDFNYYISNNGIAVPDYVVINLGINDVFGFGDDASLNTEILNVVTRYNEMIASVKAYSANVKIGIALTIPPNYSQDAFARPYDAGQTRARYKRNNFVLVEKLIATYHGREAENIYLVPLHLNLDTRYGFGMETIRVNARDTRTMEIAVANGGVHPGVTGYWQIADSYWYWLKSFEV